MLLALRMSYWHYVSTNRVIADWLSHMYDLLVGYMHNDDLSALMNGPIRKKLGIIPSHVTWGGILRS